jgi:hypothetical protein
MDHARFEQYVGHTLGQAANQRQAKAQSSIEAFGFNVQGAIEPAKAKP